MQNHIEDLNFYITFKYNIIEKDRDTISLKEASTLYKLFIGKLDELNSIVTDINNELNKVEDAIFYDNSESTNIEESIYNIIYDKYSFLDLYEGNNKCSYTYEELFKYISTQLDYYQDRTLTFSDISGKKKEALIDYCITNIYKNDLVNINVIETFFTDMNIKIQANSRDNSLNVFRQGFILLLTTVDAVIFDLVRILLDNCFFDYIGDFSRKDDKIRVSEFKEYGNFQIFKDNEIRKRLKGKYIKDILGIFQKLEVDYINNNFTILIECINRRNIHIHNQGIVDKNYEEGINPYNLKEGDVAYITEKYFNKTCGLLECLIIELCNWICKKI